MSHCKSLLVNWWYTVVEKPENKSDTTHCVMLHKS